ncbi:glycoside hydrolase [Hymenopellis radicata]|nr:glycoside hydrolase [Hymenopellis radicata]
MAEARFIELKSNWTWKQCDDSLEKALTSDGWRETKAYPSEVHVELMKNGLIPDPYLGFNEHQVQWIGETEWIYRCTFTFDENKDGREHAELEFLGLDTLCDVYLNDTKILSTKNMFQTYVVPVKPLPNNVLVLHFKSAAKLARELEAQYGKVRAGSTNLGDPSRVYVRKAQYDWRWDWGPELMTCGPHRPITLKTYAAKMSEVQTRASVLGDIGTQLKIDVVKEARVGLGTQVDWTFSKDEIKLWWPVGYGEQALYDVKLELLGPNKNVVDTTTKRVGFRSVKLIQEELSMPDQYGTGTTFLFEINGVRMFMGGSNWIPADNFLTTLTPERYRAWLILMRDGNQNMVRLWGGGIYEPDCFYDICDELGLLVWQDFQFACGVYPAHDDFVASVRKEAEDNVKRLRHHPSIAIWCGNNEDYQMVLQWGDVASFPAIKIYEEVLPSVVEALCDPPIPYHRGSPYGGKGWDTADPTIGDVHQWHIWGGKELPYQEYDRMGGRFVSEFGMPSMPVMKTIKYWMGGESLEGQHAQSGIMAQHCRAGSYERRFSIAINENFRIKEDLEKAVFITQAMQSESVGYAYQSWKRQWKGPGKQYTSGVLVWQLNDCWPVTSWAIADYFLRAKPVYYTIKRHLSTFAIGIFRNVVKNKPTDRPRQYYEFGAFQSLDATLDIWATNSSLSSRTVVLQLDYFDLTSTWTKQESHKFDLLPNQTTELLSMPCAGPSREISPPPNGNPAFTTTYSVVVGAKLLDGASGEVLARYADWPQPYKNLPLPDPGLNVTVDRAAGKVEVEVKKPAKCVFFTTDGEVDPKWSDNALDLLPGEKRVLDVEGLGEQVISVAWLGNEKAQTV